MPKFAANLMYLFQEVPLMERFSKAQQHGFSAVEHQFPYANIKSFKNKLETTELELVLINAPAGNWEHGERGLAAIPGRESDFLDTLYIARDAALTLNTQFVHIMAGIIPQHIYRKKAEKVFILNLQKAADFFQRYELNILIEPLNDTDVPGYFLNRLKKATTILRNLNRSNVFLQFDIYHCLMRGENPHEVLKENIKDIAHMQIAGVPGRHEPDTKKSSFNFSELFHTIDTIGYTGWIGCEYHPRGTTAASFGWAKTYGIT